MTFYSDPKTCLTDLRNDLGYPDYVAPAANWGSVSELRALRKHVEAVAWRMNEWAGGVRGYVKENAHCSLGTTKFNAGIEDAILDTLLADIDAAIAAAEEYDAEQFLEAAE